MLVTGILSDTVVLVAIPLYILLLIACVKYRQQDPFKSSFFALTFSQGIADLIMLAVMLFILRPAIYYDCFTEVYLFHPLAFGRLQAFFSMGLGCVQHIALLAIAFNRYSAVCAPGRHYMIWTRRTTAIVISVQWIIPLIIYLPIFTFDVQFIRQANSSGLVVEWKNQNYLTIYFLWSFALVITAVIASTIMYALQFRAMLKQRSVSGMISSQVRVEFRMALMGAIIFAISTSYLFFLLTSLVAPSFMKSAVDLSWLYFLSTEIMSAVNPFILIGMSKNVRGKCTELLLCDACTHSNRGPELSSTRIRRTF